MKFFKYQGLGNDFIVIDERDLAFAPEPHWVQQLCDRHFGIGADGVLLTGEREGLPSMTVYNADGSIAEMCGNGLRCVARYWVEHRHYPAPMTIHTGAGPKKISVDSNICIEMGEASDLGECPASITDPALPRSGRSISMGNPHWVFEGDFTAEDRARLAPLLAADPQFKEGVNVSFAQLKQEVPRPVIELFVYERGVGWTLACGTGATATAAAFWARQRIDQSEVEIHLPGGALRIKKEGRKLFLEGPAKEVFRGEI